MTTRTWIRRLFARKPRTICKAPSRTRTRLGIEDLEARTLPTGSWTALTNLAPDTSGTMLLLADGTVMMHDNDNFFGTVVNRDRWYRLTPDASGSYVNGTWSQLASMSTQRLFFASNVLPDGRVFVLGGEYSGPQGQQNWTNTGEIYNPVSNTWTNIANFPRSQFGDDPTQVLPDGRVLAGYLSAPNTYIYNPWTDSWSATGSKLRGDRSDEETWLKLPDDSVLSYDVFTEGGGTGHAQRYVPSSGTWVDAGNVPTFLSGGQAFGFELGGAVRLPDGRVWYIGANSHTAFYAPSTNTWVAGPNIPNNGSGQFQGADDAPAAIMPNGKVLLAVDHPLFNGPTNVYEFDPGTNGYTNVTPSIPGLDLRRDAALSTMLVLPTGQVLFNAGGNRLAVYTPDGSASAAWKPNITGITANTDGSFTLNGTQLNGISQGASFGDDAEMDSNYPIVQLTDASNHVYYARTYDWSSTGVATGAAPESTQFKPPAGLGAVSVRVIANGIASDPFTFNLAAGWVDDDLSAPGGGPHAAAGPAGYVTPDGTARVVYKAADGDVHELFLIPGQSWHDGDLSAQGGGPQAASAPFGYVTPDGTARVVYQAVDGDVHELFLIPGQNWFDDDLSALGSGPQAASAPFGYVTPDGTARVVYMAVDGDVHELFLVPGYSWHDGDLSAAGGGPHTASAPFGYVTPNGTARVVYQAVDNDVHELSLVPGQSWHDLDLSAAGSGPHTAGAPFGYVTPDGTARVVYMAVDGDVHELYLLSGGGGSPGGGGGAGRSGMGDGAGGSGANSAVLDRPPSANVPSATARPFAASADQESLPVRAPAVATTARRAALIDRVWSDPADLLVTDAWIDVLVWNERR